MRVLDFAPILALLVTSRVSLAQQTYTFVSFDYPGAIETSCGGINWKGEIVGSFATSAPSEEKAFLRSANGTFSTLLGGKAAGASASGINDSGAIVGSISGTGNGEAGYVLSRGGLTPVSAPKYETELTGISSNGMIVGAFSIPDSEDRFGFEIVDGKIQQLPLLGGVGVLPLGINSAGTVVVFDDEGFILYAGGSYQQIQYPGDGIPSFVSGINDSGVVVGSHTKSNSSLGQGFTYFQGTFNDVVYPGSLGTLPSGISNTGVIVGNWEDTKGFHCFVATPAQ